MVSAAVVDRAESTTGTQHPRSVDIGSRYHIDRRRYDSYLCLYIDGDRYDLEVEMASDIELREEVRERYAEAASSNSCCGPDCCATDESLGADQTGGTYTLDDLAALPVEAVEAGLGCGNPTAVAELIGGETVLDLGSGGGIDVILSARRVGKTGFAYGLDMTDEMLELANENAARAGVDNVEFLKGYIEAIPLPENSVDVVISNCVINLSTDKPTVFDEVYRVLRPGGRIGISDIVANDSLTADERAERGSWVGCIAGALSYSEVNDLLVASGFDEIILTTSHEMADGMDSVIIKATKPAA
jgi:arsenite methyltransferase